MSRRTRLNPIWVVLGVVGWVGLMWLGSQMYGTSPRTAGFDLELLLRAGRDVAAGRSPYDPALVAGAAPVAERLFYSYPPVVAQFMAIFAGVPSGVMLVAWDAAAVAGLAVVADILARRFAPDLPPSRVWIPVLCMTPIVFPFAVGLLFGNLDVFFPLLYGLLLLGVAGGRDGWAPIAGGAGATVASVTKLHPASLVLWLVVRAVRSDVARRAWLAVVTTGVAIIAVSLLIGGAAPWSEYLAVVRAGSGADLVDPRNAGPAAQIALWTGGGEAFARTLQIPVAVVALVVTVVAAWSRRDAVESLAWAAAASLVTLPVTWFHYPAAMIPFALAALLRARHTREAGRVAALVTAATVVSIVAISALQLVWLAVGLVIVAVRLSVGAKPADAV
jgi:glycosyl transferase family 87